MCFSFDELKIGIIGLGYVGLPLAVEFGKVFDTIGFDINQSRIAELNDGCDSTLECTREELDAANKLVVSASIDDLSSCDVFIVTVPTPIDSDKQPDLSPLIKASECLGKVIKEGAVVIYESTVYPGATEEDCIPVIEKVSGLKYNKDFFAGYSPERINPGDKVHRVTTIKKVTSGSNPEVAEFVDELYNKILRAGTHKASSIRVAEASKVIENVQRDVNIALINELDQIFDRLGINTKEVIEAASTKWNFMKLMPGLVGGHCIGVDPHYLLYKSEKTGYIPDLMRTAREINNGMSHFLSSKFLRQLLENKINPIELRVLLLGFSFKENCPDIRNTKVYDFYLELTEMGFDVDIYDPWVNPNEVYEEYGINVISKVKKGYGVGILCVGHDNIISQIKNNEIFFENNYIMDYKYFLQ